MIPASVTPRFLYCLVLTLALGATIAAQTPDLSGKWRLNREVSDDVKAKLENALRRPDSGARRGSDDASEGAREREREEARRRIEALIEASETLEIKQSQKEVIIVEGGLRERKLYNDGRPFQRSDRNGNLITVRARWRGEQFVVDTRLADGGRFTESYELVPGKRQLVVTVTSLDRRLKQPLVIRRVYDEEPADIGFRRADNLDFAD